MNVRPEGQELAYAQHVANELSTNTLQKLATRQLGAIHVPGFFKSEICEEIAAKTLNHEKLGHYTKKYTSTVGRICMPHIDSEWDDELTTQYHDEALPSIEGIRDMFTPYISPIDLVRLRLQELWPNGANLLRLKGRNCFVGAFRVFTPKKSSFLPHHDRIDEETDAPEIADITDQLVANVYLQVPNTGGDLQLWLREPNEKERAHIRDVEGLPLETVEKHVVSIHPEAGDLIIFNSWMLHAVSPGEEIPRVGMAAFIGVHGQDKPLSYWS